MVSCGNNKTGKKSNNNQIISQIILIGTCVLLKWTKMKCYCVSSKYPPPHSRWPVSAAVAHIHAGALWVGKRDAPERPLRANPLQNIQTTSEQPLPLCQTHHYKQTDTNRQILNIISINFSICKILALHEQ